MLSAYRSGTRVDRALTTLSFVFLSIPGFVSGLLLIYLLYYLAGWAPEPIGRLDPFAVAPPTITGLSASSGLSRFSIVA